MILMGDEVGRTQDGNNNAYCQDTAINWLKLDDLDPRNAAFLEFTRDMIAIRRTRPLFRQQSFLHNRPDGAKTVEVSWLRPDGKEMQESDWHNPEARALGMLLRNADSQILALLNSHFETVKFRLAEPASRQAWRLLVDTSTGRRPRGGSERVAMPVGVPSRSLLLFEAGLR